MTASFLLEARFFIWVLGTHGKSNSTPGRKLRGHDRLAWRACFYEIVENAVRYCFVEGAFIPIRREIKLERFAFDAKSIRNIIDIDSGKIRLPRDWANRSEIVRFKVNLVIAARGIRKSLKPRLRR